MKQYQKANTYLKKAGTIPPGVLSPDALQDFHLTRFKVDSALGNYASAIQEYEIYHSLRDSIFNIARNKQIQELEISYETKENKQYIADLKNTEKVQQLELKRVNTQRNLTLVAGILMLIIAALAYRGFRHKQKSNLLLFSHQKKIDAKNDSLEKMNQQQKLLLREKEWLVREIHHRVKNNLQTAISLLHMQSSYLSSEEALAAIRNSQRVCRQCP